MFKNCAVFHFYSFHTVRFKEKYCLNKYFKDIDQYHHHTLMVSMSRPYTSELKKLKNRLADLELNKKIRTGEAANGHVIRTRVKTSPRKTKNVFTTEPIEQRKYFNKNAAIEKLKKLKSDVAKMRDVIREREQAEAAVFIWGKKSAKQVLQMSKVRKFRPHYNLDLNFSARLPNELPKFGYRH